MEEKILDKEILEENLNRISYTLNKDYLSNLSEYCVFNFDEYCKLSGLNSEEINFKNFMAVEITQLVFNADESRIDCMKNLLSSFANTFDSLGLFIKRTSENVNLYLIFRKNGKLDATEVFSKIKLLDAAIKGNFNGTETKIINDEKDIKDKFDFLSKVKNISLLTSVPSDKSEKFISQGIEKLLNAVVPTKNSDDEEYSVLILAESITNDGIQNILKGYEDIATSLVPYLTHSFQVGKTSTETDGEMSSAATTEGISNAITRTHSINFGVNSGSSVTNADGRSFSESTTQSITKSTDYKIEGVGKSTAVSTAVSLAASQFSSIARALSMGVSGGYGYSRGKTDTTSSGITDTEGTNHSISLGETENTTYNYKSYYIQSLLDKLELTIKRINESKAVGLWKTSTYVFSDGSTISKNVANFIRGISQGEESFVENSVVHTWNLYEEKESVIELRKYLSNFIHPIFYNAIDLIYHSDKLKDSLKEKLNKDGKSFDSEFDKMYNKIRKQSLIPITATLNISTTELAKIFSLPGHSLPGLPVLECAEFGRNVATYDTESESDNSKIDLGVVYHMHNKEKLPVELQKKSLASHTFITGSTGSGKSNTVYQLLSQAKKNGCKFLVIEPAKGEYKHVFGKHSYLQRDENSNFVKDENNEVKRFVEDGIATVYSTNPKISNLLKINPFSFPHGNKDDSKNIHILEHLDRLIEIFNVCWPMYAAMPAVLKEAVEKSYEDAGWDLTESTNEFGDNLYPTFADVSRNIKIIIDSSDYDAENKGAYKGSLITRLKSLTNGINGQIFTTDAIDDKDLFNKNVIIDLSRVGSSETKSLIMGLLVLKLQEYRMTQGRMNAKLRHVTVLEEAHNLLKRTSTEVSSESANLLGKSVEMLTNAIAEMRTYGEGFIIADQAPGLLDMAVIRNTNTKIIMRLPDLGDRELVGKAANLNDNQIEELAKLPCGVAAVYQNEWIQPVLCKVNHNNVKEDSRFEYQQPTQNNELTKDSIKNRIEIAKCLCQLSKDSEKVKELKAKLKKLLTDSSSFKFSGSLYVSSMQYIDSSRRKPDYDKLSFIISTLLPEFSKTLKDSALKNPSKVEIWRNDLQEHVENILIQLRMKSDKELRNSILQCILQNYILSELNKPNLLNELSQRKTQ